MTLTERDARDPTPKNKADVSIVESLSHNAGSEECGRGVSKLTACSQSSHWGAAYMALGLRAWSNLDIIHTSTGDGKLGMRSDAF